MNKDTKIAPVQEETTSPMPTPQRVEKSIGTTLPAQAAESQASQATALDVKTTKPDINPAQAPGRLRPVVIPQASDLAIGNDSLAPFARCYPPEIASMIGRDEFLQFIDGLNEAFVARPGFDGIATMGAMLNSVDNIVFLMLGAAFAIVGLSGTKLVSSSRTRKYMKAAKKQLLEPRGLTARICYTREVMKLAGLQSGQLLPPRLAGQEFEKPQGTIEAKTKAQQDARARWLAALGPGIAELDFDVSARQVPSNWARRLGTNQAGHQIRVESKELEKEQLKVVSKGLKDQTELAGLDVKLAEIEARISDDKSGSVLREKQKLTRQRDIVASRFKARSHEARQRVLDRDERAVQSIRWLVIAPDGFDFGAAETGAGAAMPSADAAKTSADKAPASAEAGDSAQKGKAKLAANPTAAG